MNILQLWILVATVVCGIAKGSSHFGTTGGWKTVDFPNPMIDPLRCGRKEVPKSAVCDPDHLLSKTSQDEIEGHINFIKTGQVAVAIVKQMDLSEFGSDIDESSRKFCRALHDTWGVGSAEKNDGVVVFVSVEDRAVYISTGEGSKHLLNGPTIESIIHRMKPFLRQADYGGALINSVIEIEMLFAGKTQPLNTFSVPHSSGKGSSESDPIKFGFFLVMILGFGGYAMWQSRKMARMERGRIALDALIREVDNTSRGTDGDKVFITTSCPICLENFPTSETDAEDGSTLTDEAKFTAGDPDRETSSLLQSLGQPNPTSPVFDAKTPPKPKPMALRCGHTFCHDCISTYLKTNEGKKCPICRFPVHADYDGLDPRQPAMRPTPQGQPGQPQNRPGGGGYGGDDDGTSCRPSASSTYGSSQGTGGRTLESLDTSDTARVNQDPMQSDHDSHQHHQQQQQQQQQQNQDGGFFGGQRGFGARGPEFHYRLNRMRYLYPDIMTVQLLHNMNRAVDRGSLQEMRTELSTRSAEVQHTITEMRAAAERAARQSGSRGSGGSFGGGGSSGGGGGRW